VWLKTWLVSVYDRLDNPQAIQCHSPPRLKGRSIFTVNDTEFCTDPTQERKADNNNTLIIAIVVSTLINALFSVAFLLGTFRLKVFTALGVHPFDRDECEGKEMKFDVFLAFAHDDKLKARELLAFLEHNSYKVCYHQRYFIPGELVLDNIFKAIYKSKRVLCLISEKFLASDYCMDEFDIALARSIQIKRRRIVIMMSSQLSFPESVGEIQDNDLRHNKVLVTSIIEQSRDQAHSLSERRTASLKEYIARHTYIECESDSWKLQLLYAMRVNRLNGIYDIVY